MVFPRSDPERRRQLTRKLYERFRSPDCWQVDASLVSGLRNYSNNGLIGLVSNWDRRGRGLVRSLALEDLFDEIVLSSEVGYEKPDQEIFRVALERLGLEPNNGLMIGDNRRLDIEPAKSLGLGTYMTE